MWTHPANYKPLLHWCNQETKRVDMRTFLKFLVGCQSAIAEVANRSKRVEVSRKGCRASDEKRREHHEASDEPRNVQLYMSSAERRFVARSSFSDGLWLEQGPLT